MRRSRFNEETVVVRVPASRKNDVLNFIKTFEALDSSTIQQDKQVSSVDQYQLGYQAGYKTGHYDGFLKGEEFQVTQSYALAGASEEVIKMNIDMFNGRIPDSAMDACFERLFNVMLHSSVDVYSKVVRFSALVGSDSAKELLMTTS